MATGPVIGLAGGIGSGKSTVAGMLAALGAHVVDADKVGHDVYRPGTEGFHRVVDAFGPDVVGADGAIDRARLGARVFADPAELARLNAIVHPLIGDEIRKRIAAVQATGDGRPLVIEAAIMLEAGWSFFDQVWVVIVGRETAIARVTASRGLGRADVERRIDAQMTNDERRRRADVVIENDGSLADLRARVEEAWRRLPRS